MKVRRLMVHRPERATPLLRSTEPAVHSWRALLRATALAYSSGATTAVVLGPHQNELPQSVLPIGIGTVPLQPYGLRPTESLTVFLQ